MKAYVKRIGRMNRFQDAVIHLSEFGIGVVVYAMSVQHVFNLAQPLVNQFSMNKKLIGQV